MSSAACHDPGNENVDEQPKDTDDQHPGRCNSGWIDEALDGFNENIESDDDQRHAVYDCG